MTEQEKIEMIALMQEVIKPINDRLDKLENSTNEQFTKINEQFKEVHKQLDDIKEDTEITRFTTNELCLWAEKTGTMINIPFPDKVNN